MPHNMLMDERGKQQEEIPLCMEREMGKGHNLVLGVWEGIGEIADALTTLLILEGSYAL